MNTFIKIRGIYVRKDIFRSFEAITNGINYRFASSDSKSDLIEREGEKKFPGVGALALKRGTGGRSSFSGTVCTVFGANGLIGKRVVNRLGKMGTQVIVPFRGDPYDVKNLKLCGDLGQILFFPYYLRNADSIRRVVKFSNVVINLVGKDNETSGFTYDEVHVDGARLIAKICKEEGVQRFIHVSSLNLSPNPKSHVIRGGSKFLKSKYHGELAVREEFPEATIFRPADVFGDGDRFIMHFNSRWRRNFGDTLLWNKGKGVYKQPVFASDLAQGIVNAIYDNEAPGKVYDAVGPKKHELHDIVQYINRIVQKDETYGFKFSNLKYSPLFWLRLYMVENHRKYPRGGMCWDKVERENVTDVTTPGNPTLEDLGIQLTTLESQAFSMLRFTRRLNYYQDELNEFPLPPPPKAIVT